jgi:hypothetical protein
MSKTRKGAPRARRVRSISYRSEHAAKSVKVGATNGLLDALVWPKIDELKRAGFNSTAAELAVMAVLTGDEHLARAVDALIELGLAQSDPWPRLGALIGDPDNTALLDAARAYTAELHAAGLSKREAAQKAAARFGGGSFDGFVQRLRTSVPSGDIEASQEARDQFAATVATLTARVCKE